MKKTIGMIIGTLLAVGIVAAGVLGIRFLHSPERMLMEMTEDVREKGMDGLEPYLTEDAQEKMEKVKEAGNNKILQAIVGIAGESDLGNVLKSNIQNIQWEVEDILKGKTRTHVILSFNYDDKVRGEIVLVVVREEKEWKIDGFKLPSIDEITIKK